MYPLIHVYAAFVINVQPAKGGDMRVIGKVKFIFAVDSHLTKINFPD